MRLSAGGKALKIISYAFLIIGAVIILFPFYVTIITAMKTQQQSAESFSPSPPASTWRTSSLCSKRRVTSITLRTLP